MRFAGPARLGVVVAFFLTMPGFGQTGFAATPEPKVDAEPLFLTLPSYDVEWSMVRTYPDNSPDNSKVRVGDKILLTVKGAPEGVIGYGGFEVPGPARAAVEENWRLSESKPEGKPEGKKDSTAPGTQFVFFGNVLKPGKISLPSIGLKDSSGKLIARTNPLELEVQSAISAKDPNPTVPVDAKPPAGLQFPWWVGVLFGVLGLVLLAGIVFLVRRYLKNRKKREVPKPVEIPKSEDEIALAALAELEKAPLVNEKQFKRYYFGISEVIKTYFGSRYSFDAPECTSSELVSALESKRDLSDTLMDQVEILFQKMDRVKFTDYLPPHEEAARALESARQLVMSTRRAPRPAPVVAGHAEKSHAVR